MVGYPEHFADSEYLQVISRDSSLSVLLYSKNDTSFLFLSTRFTLKVDDKCVLFRTVCRLCIYRDDFYMFRTTICYLVHFHVVENTF